MKAAGNSSDKSSAGSWWSRWLGKGQNTAKNTHTHKQTSHTSGKPTFEHTLNVSSSDAITAPVQKELQNVYLEQRYEAIHQALKSLFDAMQENLYFGPADNIYIGMFLLKQQQESIRVVEKMLHAPRSIIKLVDELFSRMDLLTIELPDAWCNKVTPHLNDFQMLLTLPECEVDKTIATEGSFA